MLQRPLGYMETYLHLVEQKLYGTTQMVFNARIKGPLDYQTFEKALLLIFKGQPLMQCQIIEKDNQLFFNQGVEFSKIPIDQHHNIDRHPIIEKEYIDILPFEKYLWRANFIAQEDCVDLIFTFHHAINDGTACYYFIKNLLELCQDIIEQKTPSYLQFELLPNQEALVPGSPDWETFSKAKTSAQTQDFSATAWKYQKDVPPKQRATKNIYKIINGAALKQLITNAKNANCTVNAYLNAAMMVAASQMREQTIGMKVLTAANIRSLCQPTVPSNYLGCYVGTIMTTHQQITPTTSLASIAKAYQQQYDLQVQSQGLTPKNFDLAAVSNLIDNIVKSKSSQFSMGFMVSNLGRFSDNFEYGPLHLKDFYFATNRQAGNFLTIISAITIHNKLFLVFDYPEPLVSSDWMNKFSESLIKLLQQ